MTSSRQLPTRHDLEAVAGNPFTFTVTTTGATITSPAVTIKDGTRTTVTADPSIPTVSQASTVTTVAFSTADTTALGASAKKNYTYSLQALVNGAGPYELVAGVLTVAPVGTAGTSSTSTAALTVTVGAAALSLTVDVGARAAADITYAGSTNLSATTVEAALDELDTEKAALSDLGRVFGQRMILFGDSITTYNAGYSISGQALSTTIGDSKGFFNWANIMLGHPFNVVGNAGVAGNTSTQGLARISEVLAVESDWVCVLFGRNDDENVTTTTNLAAICSALLADGRQVILCTVPPAATGDSTAKKNHLMSANAWIKDYGRRTPGVVVADLALAIQDMTASDFVAASGVLVDGVHPNTPGAMAMGRIIRNALAGKVSANDAVLASVPTDPTNLLPNPLLYGTGTSMATSWSVAGGSGTYSWVARSDGVRGSWFQTVVGSGSALAFSSNVSIGATLAIGETVRFAIEFECESLEASATDQMIYTNIQCYNGSSFPAAGKAFDVYWDTSYVDARYPLTSGVLRTLPIVVPAATTIVQVLVTAYGGGTYRWGRASLRKGDLAAL